MTVRILYVEDNLLVQEVTAELLSREDRQIVAVASAEEALAHFERQPFDLLISDVSLPVMSGLDLARTLLQIAPQLPIIIASGYAVDLKTDSLGGKIRTIIKPFGSTEMDALIAGLLPV